MSTNNKNYFELAKDKISSIVYNKEDYEDDFVSPAYVEVLYSDLINLLSDLYKKIDQIENSNNYD